MNCTKTVNKSNIYSRKKVVFSYGKLEVIFFKLKYYQRPHSNHYSGKVVYKKKTSPTLSHKQTFQVSAYVSIKVDEDKL